MNGLKINCVANSASGDDLHKLRSLKWEEGTLACTQHTWTWALYHQLKKRGCNVTLEYNLVKDAINIIHSQVARQILNPSDFIRHFIVGIRADFRPFPYGQLEIVQNQRAEGRRRIYMPLFPQPGLIARNEDRDIVENVCISGRMKNSIDVEQLKDDLYKMGCRFIFKGEGHWHEMSEVDILLGIRSFSKKSYPTKPATKLFNAWLAGIPFIGGYDSAFEQVGKPSEDYLRVSSYDELVGAVKILRSDKAMFQKLVENGKRSVNGYTPDKITDKWMEVIEHYLIPAYTYWNKEPSIFHRLTYRLQSLRFLVREMLIAHLLLKLKRR